MKKINLKRSWKIKKKAGFYFYYIVFTMIIVLISSTISSGISEYLYKTYGVPSFYVTMGLSFIVGLIMAVFIGKVLINPIRNLKNFMNQVSEGDLTIKAPDDSLFDEVDDMYHYFNVMMDELRATEIIQSDFISNVSHEFKTPINTIEGYTTLLADPHISLEEKEQYVEKIHLNTEKMNLLINNVLLLSKLENHAIETHSKKYSLDEQIRQAIIWLEPKWVEKNVEFNIEMDNVDYVGNEGIMFHVWTNLINNAIKFGPENGKITITLKKENSKIIFTIEDEGPGINEESKKYIFNKFYQSDTSHKSEGNGLGLSLVKKIIDICDGKISVCNNVGKGCTFTVVL